MCSLYSVPLLYLNLGGEMMYILNQRLNAQRIPKDKAKKGMLREITCSFKFRIVKGVSLVYIRTKTILVIKVANALFCT